MRVEHIMTLNPVACEVGDSCADAARLMRDRAVGCVVVLDGGRVAGLLTDRLLATSCLASSLDPEATPVEDVMVRDVTCISPEDSVFTAIDALRGTGYARRLPVIGPRRELLGLVSISDLALLAQEFAGAVIDSELHNARKEARALTGAKRFAKRIRAPTQLDRLPEEIEPEPRLHRSRQRAVADPMPRRRRSAGGRARGSRWRTGAQRQGGAPGARRPAAGAKPRRAGRSNQARPQGDGVQGRRGTAREFNEQQAPSQAV
jgi:CBS domain-containing protein